METTARALDVILITALALLASCVWFCLGSIRQAYDPQLCKIPGPFLSAFTNFPLKAAILAGRRAHYIHSLHQRYGPYVRVGPREVAISDIVAHRAIHRVGSDFNKAPWYQGQVPAQHSDSTCAVFGILDNKTASRRRRLFQAAGTKKVVAEWEPQVIELTNTAIQQIKADLERHGKSDVMKWWTLMASDVTGSLAFGESFHNTRNGIRNQLVHDVELTMPLIGLRAELPWTRIIEAWTPIWFPWHPQRIWNRFIAYGQAAVEATRRAQQGNSKTLFSKMVLENTIEQVITDELIAQEAANVIVAGTDTTAITLTYLVYEVLAHPEIQARLVKELKSCSPHPTWAELEACMYLNNVIQETFRLHPAVAGALLRIVPKGGETLGSTVLPAGTQVSTQAWTMQRDANVFENPLRFEPDRWTSATPTMHEHMMIFGGAARTCVGQNIARLEILHAVTQFFREFPSVKLAKETTSESMEMVDYFAIKPKSERCVIESKKLGKLT